MDKLEPIKQPTDSRIRPLSDYSDRIEIPEVEQWVSGTIQEFLDLTDEEMAEIERNFQKCRLSLGEAWMFCNECGAKLYSFDGDRDQNMPCPKKRHGKCVVGEERDG